MANLVFTTMMSEIITFYIFVEGIELSHRKSYSQDLKARKG